MEFYGHNRTGKYELTEKGRMFVEGRVIDWKAEKKGRYNYEAKIEIAKKNVQLKREIDEMRGGLKSVLERGKFFDFSLPMLKKFYCKITQ